MFELHFRRSVSLLAGLACLALAACGSLPSLPSANRVATAVSPYKIDVVQGNVVTREQLAALKPGMPRSVVRDVLGTPLLTSLFHAQRWDYVFTLKRQGAEPQSRKVTLFFKEDVLERIEADELPSESEFAATLKAAAKPGPLPELEAPAGSLDKFPATPKPAPAPATTVAPPTNYPPLEPAAQ